MSIHGERDLNRSRSVNENEKLDVIANVRKGFGEIDQRSVPSDRRHMNSSPQSRSCMNSSSYSDALFGRLMILHTVLARKCGFRHRKESVWVQRSCQAGNATTVCWSALSAVDYN